MFWKKVEMIPFHPCWEWTGTKGTSGYGIFKIGTKKNNTTHNAQRISWIIHNGPIPKGKGFHGICVLHTCDNRGCVNPNHLFLGTQKVNVRDCVQKGRKNNGQDKKTHCKFGHEFTLENTYFWDKQPTQRKCRECRRKVVRDRYANEKA
jgi:hypothetical protein